MATPRAELNARRQKRRRARVDAGYCSQCPKDNLRPVYKGWRCRKHHEKRMEWSAIWQRPISSSTIEDLDGPRVPASRWSEWMDEVELPGHVQQTMRRGYFLVDMEEMAPRVPGGLD